MFETNTASCGGFPGTSDAFVGALWGLDYGLTMANSNFTEALWHVGDQNVYYNMSRSIGQVIPTTDVFSSAVYPCASHLK